MTEIRRAILPILYRLTGKRYFKLEECMEQLGVEGMRDLYRLLRDVEQVLEHERRTFRPFPGGPRIRG